VDGEKPDQEPTDGAISSGASLLEEFRSVFPRYKRSTSIAHIWSRLSKPGAPVTPTALCLSGGGIRSATFCLGVMQGLAKANALEPFHYLSTVSGGGYVGSWLSRWRAEEPWTQGDMVEPAHNPRPAGDGAVHPIRRLRSFSNYLSPVWGLSLESLTMITIFLRNLLFNHLIWIPLILALAGLTRLLSLLVGLAIDGWPCLLPWRGVCEDAAYPAWVATASVPVLVAYVWLVVALVLLLLPQMDESTREDYSRVGARLMLVGLVWLLPFLLFIHIPAFILQKLQPSAAEIGLASGGLVLATALFGYWNRHGSGIRKRVEALAERIGVRLLDLLAAIAIVAIAFCGALAMHAWAAWQVGVAPGAPRAGRFWQWIVESQDARIWAGPHPGDAFVVPSASRFWHFINASRPEHFWILGAFVLGAVLSSLLVGANRYSLHALYGNRLVRAYLGSARRERAPSKGTDIDPNDDVPMADLPEKWAGVDRKPALFHVVNMTLNLTRSAGHRRDWQERKAASFTATPLHCGCAHLGYAATADYGGSPGMTLGRAMTISGAAASPNMGYNSSPLVALIMTIFNIRLGWWLPNPKRKPKILLVARVVRPVVGAIGFLGGRRAVPWLEKMLLEPSGLGPILAEGLSGTGDESDWLHVSDGGHFENLGLYEMVRRRCRRIVVVDATCDGSFEHADLHNAVRKIGVDFGIPIDLPPTLPGQSGPGEKQRIVLGRIGYSALDDGYPDGVLFCVKPLLNGDEPPSLTHYAATSRRKGNTFPHHSTADQFFNETQFESYRLLGEVSGEELAPLLRARLPKGDETLNHYPLLPQQAQAAPFASQAQPAQAQPAQAPVPAEPEPPPPSLSGAQRIAGGMQTLGTGGLVAGTLTTVGAISLVGTIGVLLTLNVAGEIGLKPSTVSLDGRDRKLLEQGMTVKADQSGADLLKALTEQLRLLTVALQEPGTGDVITNGQSPNYTQLIDEIKALNQTVQSVRFSQGGGGQTIVNPPDMSAINEKLGSILTTAGQARSDSNEDLGAILQALRTLAARIEATGPRRNVRGQ